MDIYFFLLFSIHAISQTLFFSLSISFEFNCWNRKCATFHPTIKRKMEKELTDAHVTRSFFSNFITIDPLTHTTRKNSSNFSFAFCLWILNVVCPNGWTNGSSKLSTLCLNNWYAICFFFFWNILSRTWCWRRKKN